MILPVDKPVRVFTDEASEGTALMSSTAYDRGESVNAQRGTRWWERLLLLTARLAKPLGAVQRLAMQSSRLACVEKTSVVATGRIFVDDGDSVQVT